MPFMNQKSVNQAPCLGVAVVPTVAAAVSLMNGMRESGQDPAQFAWKIAELANAVDPLLTAPEVLLRASDRIAARELKRIFSPLAV